MVGRLRCLGAEREVTTGVRHRWGPQAQAWALVPRALRALRLALPQAVVLALALALPRAVALRWSQAQQKG